jgi:hypothetical protein
MRAGKNAKLRARPVVIKVRGRKTGIARIVQRRRLLRSGIEYMFGRVSYAQALGDQAKCFKGS